MLPMTAQLLEMRLKSIVDDVRKHLGACSLCWEVSTQASQVHRIARLA